MGRTEAKSGLVAKRPMATTSGASLPRDVSVLSMVADLEGRDLDGLRRQWRAHLGGEAPAHLPRWLLMRVSMSAPPIAMAGWRHANPGIMKRPACRAAIDVTQSPRGRESGRFERAMNPG